MIVEEYTQPFSGTDRVQFSDTDAQDDRFIRADAVAVMSLAEMQ